MTKANQKSAKFHGPALILQESLAGLRANLLPGLILWTFAFSILLLYYFNPAMNLFLTELAALKDRFGYRFSLISTALFGGLLPFLVSNLFWKNKEAWQLVFFYLVFWGYKGLEVDFLYRLQAGIFGENPGALQIVFKVLVDQFIYVPIIAIPIMVLLFIWKEEGFSLKKTRLKLKQNWLSTRVLPVMLTNWFIWIPAVSIIYTLPLALQLPFQNLVLLFFSLVMIFMSRKKTAVIDKKEER